MSSSNQDPVIQASLTNIVVTTSDIDRQVRFYEGTLGFKSFYRDKTSCFLKAGGVNLVFVHGASEGDMTKGICLDVSVPDLGAAALALKGAGLEVDASDPLVLKLKDPDGNLVEVVKG